MKSKWTILLIVCIGVFMSTLQGSIVNIANPIFSKSFDVPMSQVQWVATVYMLIITVTMLFFGKLGDKKGSHYVYIGGFLVFSIGSFLCSIATSLTWLIMASVIGGLGASALMGTGLAIVSNTFPMNEKGKAIGIVGAVVGVGNMSGPALGGVLLEFFNWPVIYIINIPIGIIAMFLGIKIFPKQPINEEIKSFDIAGTLLFFVSVSLLLVTINTHTNYGWALALGAGIFFVLFIIREFKHEQSLLDIPLFKHKDFTWGNIIAIFCYFPQMSVTFLLPFYLEQLKNYSTITAGFLLCVHPLGMIIIAPIAGALSDKQGAKKVLLTAFILMTLGFVGMALLKEDTSILVLIISLLTFGLGVGCFNAPNNSTILSDVPPQKQGYGGSFLATARNLCYALGISFFSSFFASRMNIYEKTLSYNDAYISASNMVYWIAATCCFIGLVLTIFFMKARNQQTEQVV